MEYKKMVTFIKVNTENKTTILLKYFLIKKHVGSKYGICIEKYLILEKGLDFIEEETVYCARLSKDETLNLIKKLSKYSVSPISLEEVVIDYLKELMEEMHIA